MMSSQHPFPAYGPLLIGWIVGADENDRGIEDDDSDIGHSPPLPASPPITVNNCS